MTRSFRPFTPPLALPCFAQASAAKEMDPQAAAGPESGALIPRTASESVTPGACAKAADAESNTASPASALRRICSSPSWNGQPVHPARSGLQPRRPRLTAAADAPMVRGPRRERHMERKAILHRWESMPTEQLNERISRRMITGDRMMLAHIYLKKGAVVPRHQHENEQ